MELGDGRVVFIKAAGNVLDPDAPAMHRREGQTLRAFSAEVPAPRLIGVADDGDWVVLVTEWVDGRMPVATERGDVERLLALLDRIADDSSGSEDDLLDTFANTHPGVYGHWQLLAGEPLPGLDAWTLRHVERLAELDALTPEVTAGGSLVHADVRTDNVLLSADGPAGDVLVDWPGASRGAPWIDLVGSLPALHLDGGPPPGDVFAGAALGRAADAIAVDALVASMAGYFTRTSLLPAPPGLPTVRAFQAAQGAIARAWAAERLRLT